MRKKKKGKVTFFFIGAVDKLGLWKRGGKKKKGWR